MILVSFPKGEACSARMPWLLSLGASSAPRRSAAERPSLEPAVLLPTPKYSNALLRCDAPDPGGIVSTDQRDVIVVTTGGDLESGAFPLWFSSDGGFTFHARGHALPAVPKWWDAQALVYAERMRRFFNGSAESHGPKELRQTRKPASRPFAGEPGDVPPWARVKFWAPEVRVTPPSFPSTVHCGPDLTRSAHRADPSAQWRIFSRVHG